MDEDEVRRLFADSESPIRPAPTVGEIRRAARRRRARMIGVQGVAVAAAASIAFAVLTTVGQREPTPHAATPPLSCLTGEPRDITDTLPPERTDAPTASAAVAQITDREAPRSLSETNPGSARTIVLARRDTGGIAARFIVVASSTGWRIESVTACSDFLLDRPASTSGPTQVTCDGPVRWTTFEYWTRNPSWATPRRAIAYYINRFESLETYDRDARGVDVLVRRADGSIKARFGLTRTDDDGWQPTGASACRYLQVDR